MSCRSSLTCNDIRYPRNFVPQQKKDEKKARTMAFRGAQFLFSERLSPGESLRLRRLVEENGGHITAAEATESVVAATAAKLSGGAPDNPSEPTSCFLVLPSIVKPKVKNN